MADDATLRRSLSRSPPAAAAPTPPPSPSPLVGRALPENEHGFVSTSAVFPNGSRWLESSLNFKCNHFLCCSWLCCPHPPSPLPYPTGLRTLRDFRYDCLKCFSCLTNEQPNCLNMRARYKTFRELRERNRKTKTQRDTWPAEPRPQPSTETRPGSQQSFRTDFDRNATAHARRKSKKKKK